VNEWLFDQPPNCAAITLHRILDGSSDILYVVHDEEDHGWQFLDGGDVYEEDAAVVSLEQIVKLDNSIKEIATIRLGARAWRETVSSPWQTDSE